jgi:hypothetical protein
VGELGERSHGLGAAVHAWEYFVAECERGYQYSIEEFDNEMGCRDTIEEMLYAPEPGDKELFGDFHRRVEAADERFRRLALKDHFRQREGVAWWHRVIVKRAGAELSSDLGSQYGVWVRVVGRTKLP